LRRRASVARRSARSAAVARVGCCYGLNKGKRWFRRQLQTELDTNLVFSIICALSLSASPTSAATLP
jgi:hypothetical protein